MRATRITVGLVVALLALTSCDGTPQEPPPPAALVLETLTPGSPTGIVGEDLAAAPVVLVREGDGLPVVGIQVSFVVTGSGSVGSATVRTDAAGLATPGTWRLGPGAGLQTLTARAGGRSLMFTADAQPGPIRSLLILGGDFQGAAVGGPLPLPLRVRAHDRYGNVVTGAWSPDGMRIAFSRCDLRCDIYVIRPDGSGLTQLTTTGNALTPVWSPDGTRIAYADVQNEHDTMHSRIMAIPADGGEPVTLVAPGWSPSWRPRR